MCIILEGSWRVGCEVLEPLIIAEGEFLDRDKWVSTPPIGFSAYSVVVYPSHLRLCESDEQQRDRLLARLGGSPEPFERTRNEAFARVRRTYFID